MGEHEHVESLLGVYALDAVDPDEAALVEAHIAHCPRCAAEVADHREVAAMLANTGEDAPSGIWERIQEGLEETPPPLKLPMGDQRPDQTQGGVVDLRDARRRRDSAADAADSVASTPRWRRFLPAGAVAAAVLLGVLAVGVLPDRDSTSGISSSTDLADVARGVLDDPTARRASLTAVGDAHGATARAAIAADGSGYLVGYELPSLASTETYQLWGTRGGLAISLGVLGADPDVIAFHADAGIESLVITRETAGGVEKSANAAFVAGLLS